MRKAWVFLACCFCCCGLVAQEPAVRHELIPHPADAQRKVEFFWTRPAGEGPWPAVVLVHGHQVEEERPGARIYLESPTLLDLRNQGYLVAAVSQPGYGQSDGPPDFCGPISQGAVRAVLSELRSWPEVRVDRIALYGHSRGAVTISMVATQEHGLAGLILGGGVYDMASAFAAMPEGSGIRVNILQEAGDSQEAFKARSALLSDATLTVPTLILHGEKDPIAKVEDAIRLQQRLLSWGTPVELRIFPDTGHGIPWTLKGEGILRFLAERLSDHP